VPESRLETGHASGAALGAGSAHADVAVILAAHEAVLPTVRLAAADLSDAIDLIVATMSTGGHLLYVGAGTSGWLGALDAAEVVVSFGMAGRVDSVVGGGRTLDPASMTLGDDAVDALREDEALAACGTGDAVIAVSASGSTPFTVAAVEQLRAQGARVIAVVSDEGTPLSTLADVVICIPTAGEVVAGSTRLTAGLAQKIVLNTLSTGAMVRLGRAFNGQMVCLEPLNEKLRQRVVRAVALAAGVAGSDAAAALEVAGRGDVAVVSLLTGCDATEARRRLDGTFGSIPAAINART